MMVHWRVTSAGIGCDTNFNISSSVRMVVSGFGLITLDTLSGSLLRFASDLLRERLPLRFVLVGVDLLAALLEARFVVTVLSRPVPFEATGSGGLVREPPTEVRALGMTGSG